MIAAERHVVCQNINSVETRHGDHGMVIPFGLRRGITVRYDGEFTTQDLYPPSSSRNWDLMRSASFFHEVAHLFDPSFGGEDFAVVGHTLTRDNWQCMELGVEDIGFFHGDPLPYLKQAKKKNVIFYCLSKSKITAKYPKYERFTPSQTRTLVAHSSAFKNWPYFRFKSKKQNTN